MSIIYYVTVVSTCLYVYGMEWMSTCLLFTKIRLVNIIILIITLIYNNTDNNILIVSDLY